MAEDWKKLSYFLQDKFFAAENVYNDAADHLHDTISNFVKLDNPAYDSSTESSFRDATKLSPLYLLRIALSKFSDKFSDWENFRHTFESLVDSCCRTR